jgi:hypothetical protein
VKKIFTEYEASCPNCKTEDYKDYLSIQPQLEFIGQSWFSPKQNQNHFPKKGSLPSGKRQGSSIKK